MSDGNIEYTFTWFIENYTYCWHENRYELLSPKFTADYLEGTVWCLQLYPRRLRAQDQGYVSLYLCRKDADGPEDYPLKYELSVLAADGETLKSLKCTYTFKKGVSYGFHEFLKMNKILMHGKTVYFPADNLRLRCKMWKEGGNVHSVKVTQISARTRIGIEKIAFLHEVEGFSVLEANQKETIRIRSPSKEGAAFSCSLYVTDGPCCQGKIMVEIVPSEENQILSRCKLSLLDESKRKIECVEADNRLNATGKDIQILHLLLSRQEILNRKHDYLPNDTLSLSCECTFTTGVEYEKIEKTKYGKFFEDSNQMCDNDTYAENLSEPNSALDDFKEIYIDQFLSDMEIKTKTKSFPAHKMVLCARSPVFRAAMSNDMKEKNSNIIHVDEIEDHILQKLLLFLYSDNIETLQWESANKLYYAADKYAIEKLKMLCSSFLVNNLSISTASELLLLADLHNDSNLKKGVEDFIFKHESKVYGSDEWKKLLETNPRLVSKTMMVMHERKL